MNKDKRKASLQEVMTHEQEYWLPVLVPAMELINLFGAGGGTFLESMIYHHPDTTTIAGLG